MPNTLTSNYNWTIIEVGANADQWGSLLNTNFTDIDADLYTVSTVASAALPKAGGTMTGVIVGATPAAGPSGYASVRFPHGTAPTDNLANGDVWSTTSGLFARINGSTKPLAFTDSSISGNAATANQLLTARSISSSGDVVWTVNFDGSGNVSGTAEIQAGVITASELATGAVTTDKIADGNVTLAKITNLTASRVLGRSSGSGAPEELTGTQVAALLNLASIVSGTQSLPEPDYISAHAGYIQIGDAVLQGGWNTTGASGLATVTFPLTFPNACIAVIAVPWSSSSSWGTDSTNYSVRIINVTNITDGNFSVISGGEDTGADVFVARTGVSFSWMALGW